MYHTLNILFSVVIIRSNTNEPMLGGCWMFVQGLIWLLRRYSLRFKTNVTFGYKLCYKIKVTFGEISLKLRQTSLNVAKINVSVVVDELPNQIIVYTCLTIDIWTWWCRRTSTRFYALWCHPPKMVGFQWNWRQRFLTLLWTPWLTGKRSVRATVGY